MGEPTNTAALCGCCEIDGGVQGRGKITTGGLIWLLIWV